MGSHARELTPFHRFINYYCRTDIDEAEELNQLKSKNYELAVDRNMHPWMTGIHNKCTFVILAGPQVFKINLFKTLKSYHRRDVYDNVDL